MKETLSELDLYICQPKDTLTSISKMYNIEVDDILLTELYNKRKCPTNIIATVFKIDEGQIIERLTELNLI